MKTPLVTQREYEYPAEATLMSTTDLDSHISYANEAFVAVSGFEREELIGKAHHVVRHPDMPRQAFADLWATLRSGHAWTALVKNRRRDGDHYWVRANVAPVVRQGRVRGYISVRTQPGREEVAAAETLYRRIREGAARSLRFRRGLVLRGGLHGLLDGLQTLSVSSRLRLALWPLAGLPLAWALLADRKGDELVLLLALQVAAVLLLDHWLRRQITRPLEHVAEHAAAVAAGCFAKELRLPRIDAIGMILRSLNQAGLNLRALVADAGAQVEALKGVTSAVDEASHALGHRTEETAQRLGEAGAELSILRSGVARNAELASQAHAEAADMDAAAQHSGSLSEQLEMQMQGIRASSREIDEIASLIDGIAFQTNLLALNAAVEAARAGTQGRGFAVVAAEVRQLAQRSQAAARQVKQLVEASGGQVQRGAELAVAARQASQAMREQVRGVTRRVSDIRTASQQQATAVEHLQTRVDTLNQATQHNASSAEESARHVQTLREQVEALSRSLQVFRHA